MKKHFTLYFILALILLISSCEIIEYQATEPENLLLGGGVEELSVYDHYMKKIDTEKTCLGKNDIIWWDKKLKQDLGINLKEVKASELQLLDGPGFAFVVKGDTIDYMMFDDAEPPPEEEESFEDCVANCIRDCMEGIDPNDPNYGIIWKLCNRECRIACAHRHPKGRFYKRPSW